MKKAMILAATLALLSAPALAQRGGGGVQEGQSSMAPGQGAGFGGATSGSSRGSMKSTGASSKKMKRSKKSRRSSSM